MQRDELWVRHIPVISTVHAPGPEAIVKLGLSSEMAAPYAEGLFFHVDCLKPDFVISNQWLATVTEWADRKGYGWLCFDRDGDEIRELPTYEEEWA